MRRRTPYRFIFQYRQNTHILSLCPRHRQTMVPICQQFVRAYLDKNRNALVNVFSNQLSPCSSLRWAMNVLVHAVHTRECEVATWMCEHHPGLRAFRGNAVVAQRLAECIMMSQNITMGNYLWENGWINDTSINWKYIQCLPEQMRSCSSAKPIPQITNATHVHGPNSFVNWSYIVCTAARMRHFIFLAWLHKVNSRFRFEVETLTGCAVDILATAVQLKTLDAIHWLMTRCLAVDAIAYDTLEHMLNVNRHGSVYSSKVEQLLVQWMKRCNRNYRIL